MATHVLSMNKNAQRGWKMAACRLAGEISDNSAYLALSGLAVRGSEFFFGAEAGERMANRCVSLAGMPLQRLIGIEDNLHSHELRMRLWNRTGPFRMVTKRPYAAHNGPLRVGYVSEITYTASLILEQCAAFPEDHRLFVFSTRAGEPLESPPASHISFARSPLCRAVGFQHPRRIAENAYYVKAVRDLARRINQSELDLLILANYRLQELNDLAMLVDTPCVVARLFGSAPSFHPKVDYCLYAQRHLPFPLMGTKLCSVFTGKLLRAEPCCTDPGPLYEKWHVPAEGNPDWEARPPCMVFHGNLVQLQSPSYLALIGDILEVDRNARFLILGFGEGLSTVLETFERRKLSGQVEYLGEVDKSQQLTGEFQEKIISFLRRGRLEADPWPWGGGAARVEAYVAGTPTVHLRMVPENGDVLSDGQMEYDVPSLEVPSSTALSLEEYRNLCMKCLYDGDFARNVVREQYAVVGRVTDACAWWENLLESYRQWLTGTGWAAGEHVANGRPA